LIRVDIATMSTTIGSSRGRRIRSLIALLVIVPLTGLVLLGIVALRPRLRAVEQAKRMETHLQQTEVFIEFSGYIGSAQLPWLATSASRELGINPGVAHLLLGFDPTTRAQESARTINQFLAEHKSDPSLTHIGDDWLRLERDLQKGSLTAEEIFNGFAYLQDEVEKGWRLESNAALALTVQGSTDLDRKIELVSSSLDLSATNSESYSLLFEMISSGPKDTMELRLRIAGNQTESRIVHQRILDLVGPKSPRRESAKSLLSSPAAAAARVEEDNFLAGREFRMKDNGPVRIAAGVKSGLAQIKTIEEFVSRSVSDTRQASQELRRTTDETLQQMIMLFAALFTISVLIAAYVSAAVTRPLRALANRAKRVAEGDLTFQTQPLDGPREISLVSDVVDDLAAHLQRVQLQAGALATGSFEDDVLAEAVPGALGANLTASVSRLMRSIQEREDLQEQLSQQATHDSLTGLPNRAAAMMAVEQAMARAVRRNEMMAVMFVDLDDFKRANDQGGHAVGDEALRLAGARIKFAVRNGDVVARLGGDEFLVVAESIESVEAIREIADRIVEEVAKPMEIEGGVVRVGASVGFALPNNTDDSAGELLQRADLAMYQAKQNGRGRVVEFDTDLGRATAERRALELAMAVAINEDALQVHFQPVLDARSGEVTSVEALLRWDRPGFGPQSPARFIPILEATPLIIDIGRWVLRRATQLVQERRQIPEFANLSVAVNLSGRHLMHASLLDDVRNALEFSGLPPEALIVEITETALVTDLATVVEQTRALHAMGVRIAIDDFGTGYTSIGQLSRLPVDILKIDRSFVDQIGLPSSRRIVELIIEVGHTLEMVVVAEGIEDIEQLRILAALDCDSLQGFFLGVPVPLAEIDIADPIVDRYFADRNAFEAARSK
jgi:diguanylate cyclase (GGDEF)-like protein